MKLRFNQLEASLAKGLAPVYLIAGDEPLQAVQAADTVRAAARGRGYDERCVLDAEIGFDWATLRGTADNLSLFSQRRLLDFRMPTARPGVEGSKVLTDYAMQPPPDTVLLVQSGKLDRAALNSAWLKALDRVGVILQVWPFDARETLRWIEARLTEKSLKVNDDALRTLAELAQGNLLAAYQEIEKLSLLYGEASARNKVLGSETILSAVADSARFNVFELAAAATIGNCAQAVRILQSLAAGDGKPALVLWSLAEQARLLTAISHKIGHGATIGQATRAHSPKQRLALSKGLRRATVAQWEACLQQCARVDFVIKGQEPGSPWDELLNLTLKMCGQPLFTAVDERV
jgi:DNA polymerase III subunit delta